MVLAVAAVAVAAELWVCSVVLCGWCGCAVFSSVSRRVVRDRCTSWMDAWLFVVRTARCMVARCAYCVGQLAFGRSLSVLSSSASNAKAPSHQRALGCHTYTGRRSASSPMRLSLFCCSLSCSEMCAMTRIALFGVSLPVNLSLNRRFSTALTLGYTRCCRSLRHILGNAIETKGPWLPATLPTTASRRSSTLCLIRLQLSRYNRVVGSRGKNRIASVCDHSGFWAPSQPPSAPSTQYHLCRHGHSYRRLVWAVGKLRSSSSE